MTLWNVLIKKANAKAPKPYTFASPEFIEAFTKIAADYGCNDEEIDKHLDFLENRHKRTDSTTD